MFAGQCAHPDAYGTQTYQPQSGEAEQKINQTSKHAALEQNDGNNEREDAPVDIPVMWQQRSSSLMRLFGTCFLWIHSLGGLVGLIRDLYHVVCSLVLAVSIS